MMGTDYVGLLSSSGDLLISIGLDTSTGAASSAVMGVPSAVAEVMSRPRLLDATSLLMRQMQQSTPVGAESEKAVSSNPTGPDMRYSANCGLVPQ